MGPRNHDSVKSIIRFLQVGIYNQILINLLYCYDAEFTVYYMLSSDSFGSVWLRVCTGLRTKPPYTHIPSPKAKKKKKRGGIIAIGIYCLGSEQELKAIAQNVNIKVAIFIEISLF